MYILGYVQLFSNMWFTYNVQSSYNTYTHVFANLFPLMQVRKLMVLSFMYTKKFPFPQHVMRYILFSIFIYISMIFIVVHNISIFMCLSPM